MTTLMLLCTVLNMLRPIGRVGNSLFCSFSLRSFPKNHSRATVSNLLTSLITKECLLYHVSCLISPISRLLSPVSCFQSHISCLTSPVPHLLSHISCRTSPVSGLLSHVWFILSHFSCVTSPVSHLLSHISCLTSPVSHLTSLVIRANCSQKMSESLGKFFFGCCMFLPVFLNFFSPFMPMRESFRSLFAYSLFFKERLEWFPPVTPHKRLWATVSALLFFTGELFFCSQKTSESLEKPIANSQPSNWQLCIQ